MLKGTHFAKRRLEKLTDSLRVCQVEKAREIVLEAAKTFVLSGHGEPAIEAYRQLIDGSLRLNPRSALVGQIDHQLPMIFHGLGQSCPALFTAQAMTGAELADLAKKMDALHESGLMKNRFAVPPKGWDATLEARVLSDTGQPLSDSEQYGFRVEVFRRLQQEVIEGNLEEGRRLLALYDRMRNMSDRPPFDWVSMDVFAIAVRLSFAREETQEAVDHIRSRLSAATSFPNLAYVFMVLIYCPKAIHALLQGCARDIIGIDDAAVEAFLNVMKHRQPTFQTAAPSKTAWRKLMKAWDAHVFREENDIVASFADAYPKAFVKRSGVQPAARKSDIVALERRLGTELPPSLVSFLQFSNGYTLFNFPEVLYGTDKIDWFVAHNKEYADIWNEHSMPVDDDLYNQYGPDQDPINMRSEYLYTALQISNVADGYVYLLNPKVIDACGEWEAWDFGSKIPGAYRYRSFLEMMCAVRDRQSTAAS